MVKIQDVVVPTKGVGKYFRMEAIKIELPGTYAKFLWELFDETDGDLGKVANEVILSGNLYMSTSEYNQWTSDDNFPIDWALQQLGFTKL